MTKQQKKAKPAKAPFELVMLGGTMTLMELTSEAAVVRIAAPGSLRAYQVGLPVASLRAWITSVDEAVAAHEARLAAENADTNGDGPVTSAALAAEEPA